MKLMKGIFMLFFVGILFSTFSPIISAADYPGTNIDVEVGDVIYSPKGKSTFFAGHVAIVGTDGYIYHAYPDSDGKRRDTVNSYFNLFADGDEFQILRSNNIDPEAAAEFAEIIYDLIDTYTVLNINLIDFDENYCSKFIWQAYFYGSGMVTDITGQGLQYNDQAWIYPNDIRDSSEFDTVVTFEK